MTDIQAKIGDEIDVHIIPVPQEFIKADMTGRSYVMVQETINGKRVFFDNKSSPARAGDFVRVQVTGRSRNKRVYFVTLVRPLRVGEKS